MKRVRYIVFITMILTYVSPAFAQGTDREPLPTLVVLPTRDGSNPVPLAYAEALLDNINNALALDPRLAPIRYRGPLTEEEILATPPEPKPRFMAHARFSEPQDDLVGIQAWFTDLQNGKVLAEAWASAVLDLSFPVQSGKLATELAQGILEIPNDQLATPVNLGGRFFFDTLRISPILPGTKVTHGDGTALGVAITKELTIYDVSIEEGQNLVLRFEKNDYHTSIGNFLAKSKDQNSNVLTIEPPWMPIKSTFRLHGLWNLNNPKGIGISARLYTSPDWNFWELRTHLNLDTIRLNSAITDPENIRWYREISTSYGVYLLLVPQSILRIYGSTRVGILEVGSTLSGTQPNLDTFIQPWILGLELNLPWFTLAQEIGYRYYWGFPQGGAFAPGYPIASPRIDLLLSPRLEELW